MAEHHLDKSFEQHGNEGSPSPLDHEDNSFLLPTNHQADNIGTIQPNEKRNFRLDEALPGNGEKHLHVALALSIMIAIPLIARRDFTETAAERLYMRDVVDGRETNVPFGPSRFLVLADEVGESDGTEPVPDGLSFQFGCRFPAADRPRIDCQSRFQGAAVKKTQEVCSDASPWGPVQQRIGPFPGPAEQSQSRPGAAASAILSDIAIMQDAQSLFDKVRSPDLFAQVSDVQDQALSPDSVGRCSHRRRRSQVMLASGTAPERAAV